MTLGLDDSKGAVGYYKSPGVHPIHASRQIAHDFRLNVPPDLRPKFSWAAFAYAGMRSVDDTQVAAIKEPEPPHQKNNIKLIEP